MPEKKRATRKKVPEHAPEGISRTAGNKTTIIAVTAIIAAALITGIAATLISKKKAPVELQSAGDSINIIDPVTKKKYSIKLDPASASMESSDTFNAQAQAVPTGDPSAKHDFKYLFKTPESKTAIAKISLEEAKYLYDSGKAVFVDARGDNQFNELHIKGAISIPAGADPSVIKAHESKLRSAKVAVAYCHGVGCHLADKTAYLLFDAGYTNVVIFFGGWNQWTQANYPVSK